MILQEQNKNQESDESDNENEVTQNEESLFKLSQFLTKRQQQQEEFQHEELESPVYNLKKQMKAPPDSTVCREKVDETFDQFVDELL